MYQQGGYMQLQSNNRPGNYLRQMQEPNKFTPDIPFPNAPSPTKLTQMEPSQQPHECLLACCSCDDVPHTITLPTFLELV
jgi:hypothetical protein